MSADAELLARYAKGRDAEAFAELVRRYAGMVYATCLRVTGNPHDAEDVAQQCFLTLARESSAIRASLPAWLHRLAVNRSLNALRAQSRRRRREEEAVRMIPSQAAKEPTWDEIAPHVDRALLELPGELREPLMLCFLQGKTQAEAAEELHVDRSTISRRLQEGIERLRRKLGKAGLIIPAAALTALLINNAAQAAPPALIAGLGKMALAGAGATTKAAAAGGILGNVSAAKAALLVAAVGVLVGTGALVYRAALRQEKPTTKAMSPAGQHSPTNAAETKTGQKPEAAAAPSATTASEPAGRWTLTHKEEIFSGDEVSWLNTNKIVPWLLVRLSPEVRTCSTHGR